MSSEGYGPAPRTAGTRYCRAGRGRGAPGRGAFVARHSADGIVLVKCWRPPEPQPSAQGRRGRAVFTVAVAALATTMTLLLAGVPTGQPDTGPCAARASVEAYAGGHLLRLRAEPGAGSATLVHLCAGDSIGRVRSWAISIKGDDRTAAVQRVADRVALASVPIGPGTAAVAVTVVPESGQSLTFTAPVTSP
ncbi:hypothetical protein [Actinoplanes auranticolor]|uniref:Uncharacterized protein n=1 Tax=Actinoplanes auranticolor TaxID=47988 RepID=A0A919S886_9ACTN|nr:hypothetical protein [Actinoplanes auranticolor]GIM66702.1 hypothetical protein Aau02nite_24060 [Actinoplanes auranticolor]